MSKDDFSDYFKRFVGRHRSFHLTFLFEAGQGYHVVLHDGAGCKERIGVTFSSGVMERSSEVYAILKNQLRWSTRVDRIVCRLLGSLGKRGSVLLIVENQEVTEANFHRGELWP